MEVIEKATAGFCLQGRHVVSIEQKHTMMHLIDGHVVLIENKHGVTVDGETTRQTCDLLERQFAGDYSWVINRKEDYSVALVETYDELNSRPRLKKIAIVSYRKLTETIAAIEKELCHKELSVFSNVEEAIVWASSRPVDDSSAFGAPATP